MKGFTIVACTFALITLYVFGFTYYLIVEYPDNSPEAVETKVKIREKLDRCSVYLSAAKGDKSQLVSRILEVSINVAERIEESRIRSQNSADYAMYANRLVWGGTIGAPLYIILLFALVPSSYFRERNKSIAMTVAFLAVLNFANTAYDSHGRWGFSRISQYHKESLIDQWLYRINIGCITKSETDLINLITKETNTLLMNFETHRNQVTPSFFSGEFNTIPDPSEVIP